MQVGDLALGVRNRNIVGKIRKRLQIGPKSRMEMGTRVLIDKKYARYRLPVILK
jgi:hypothetical protein